MSESRQDDPDGGDCADEQLSRSHSRESRLPGTGVLVIYPTIERRKEAVRRLLSPLSAGIHNPVKRSEQE